MTHADASKIPLKNSGSQGWQMLGSPSDEQAEA